MNKKETLCALARFHALPSSIPDTRPCALRTADAHHEPPRTLVSALENKQQRKQNKECGGCGGQTNTENPKEEIRRQEKATRQQRTKSKLLLVFLFFIGVLVVEEKKYADDTNSEHLDDFKFTESSGGNDWIDEQK